MTITVFGGHDRPKKFTFWATVLTISVAALFFAKKMLSNIEVTCGFLFGGLAAVSLPLILPCLPMQISWWSVVLAFFFLPRLAFVSASILRSRHCRMTRSLR